MESYKVGEELGFDSATTESIVKYLVEEGLIKRLTYEGGISIEHSGVLEVEEALENPSKPTEHFPAIYNITNNNYGVMYGVQQGTNNSSQTNNFTTEKARDLKEIISKLNTIRNLQTLSPETRQELNSEIDTLQSQSLILLSPKLVLLRKL